MQLLKLCNSNYVITIIKYHGDFGFIDDVGATIKII